MASCAPAGSHQKSMENQFSMLFVLLFLVLFLLHPFLPFPAQVKKRADFTLRALGLTMVAAEEDHPVVRDRPFFFRHFFH